MNDTLLYNGGLELLEQFLQKWLEDNNEVENREIYKIFLPKTEYKDSDLMFKFPIYKVEEGKCKLISWINFNVTKNMPATINNSEIEIFNESLLDFDFEMVRGLIELYYNLFVLELNTARLIGYPELLESEKRKVKAYIEDYQTELKNLRFDEYGLQIKNPVIEEIVEVENEIVEEILEEPIVKEKTDYEYALEMIEGDNSEVKGHNSETTKYDFKWENNNKLRFVSDKTLEIAYKIIKYGKMKLSVNDKEEIKINNCISTLCQKKYTTDKLAKSFRYSNSYLGSCALVEKESGDFTWKLSNLERVCEDCKFEKCPKMYAAYILYLYNNGLLKEALEDRKKYREENEYNDYYNFVWKNKDGLKRVSKEIFDFASAICDNGGVFVERELRKDCIKIFSYYSCQDYRTLNNDINEINSDEIMKRKKANKYSWIDRRPTSNVNVCGVYNNCRLGGCPFVVAGYIQYLKVSGKEQQIIDDRKYYEENRERIDKELKDELETEIRRELKKQKVNVENFADYKDDVENIEDLFDMLDSPYQKSFHCVITCKDKKERDVFANKIRDELINKQKITHKHKGKTYSRLPLRNFSSRTLYSWSGFIKGSEGDTNVAKVDDEGFITCDKNDMYIKETDSVVRLEILKNHLYIIDDISEFVRDYNEYKTWNSDNIRRKQAERTLDILTNLEDDNYLILLGTDDEIEALFELDNRFKFAYQDSVFKIKEMPISQMFDSYVGLLKSELLVEVRTNKEAIKSQFENYISLNKEFIPLSNREIVNYLANYTNKKDKLELPENLYKKETIDESLKNIVGHQNVKNKLKDFEKYMIFQLKAKANGMNIKSSNLHMIFTGNSGTGKTTVARIMAKMLYDLGMLKENKLVEVERKDLIAEYTGQTAPKTTQVIEKAIGGVLFIDEAYSLAEGRDSFGKEAVATLIKAMEDKKDQFVVIFAGYKDEMKTFTDSNPGISSRIGYTFDFPDYSTDELVEIFNSKMSNMGFELDEKIQPHLKNICEYFSKRKDFGNGRFINRLIQETIIKHSLDENAEIKLIKITDIPTMEQLANTSVEYNRKELKQQLDNIIGMEDIKENLIRFEKLVSFNKKAIEEGIEIPSMNMHMLFTGNPGTGKTMIARIIAKMLFDVGVIYENKIVEVERKDLIGVHQGETAKKTNEVIEKAMGGVLFIDEAYSLTEGRDSYGKEAIATLIKAMEDKKDQFIVIFAGYRDEMKTFLDANSGIASRIGYTFEFKDYSPEELFAIFKLKISKAGFEYTEDIEKELLNIFKYFSKRKSFGNGRFVDKLIQEVIIKHTMNEHENIKLITLDDIPTIVELNPSRNDSNIDAQKALDSVIGLEDLKEKVKEFTSYIKFVKDAQNTGINIPDNNMHMIFTGNPGTGKTMVARIMAKLFFDMGFIHENKLVEVERKDLIAGYVGQTAPKTTEVIEKAMGGVLFIDEAYTLALGKDSHYDFGSEAIATLIKAMEDHKGEFIVIFAGYQDEMREFIDMNPGIASRVGYTFDFPDYTVDELEKIFYKKIQNIGLEIEEDTKNKLHDLIQYFEGLKNAGNGRLVDKILQNTLLKMAKKRSDDLKKINVNHIPTIPEMNATLLGGEDLINPEDITEESFKKTAAHEVGHATIMYLLNGEIDKITIKAEARGTLGYVRSAKSTTGALRKSELLNKIKIFLAGTVAEEVYFGEHANGNGSDLERASSIAYSMVTRYGMSDLGYVQLKNPEGEIAKLVFDEQNKIVKKCYDETYELIKKYKSNMDFVVEYLLEKGEITEEEFIGKFNKSKPNEDAEKENISANTWSIEPLKTDE